MEYISLEEIRRLVSQCGSQIVWVGTLQAVGVSVWIRDKDTEVSKHLIDPDRWERDSIPKDRLEFVERDDVSLGKIGVCPPDETWGRYDRKAAAFGVNIGGDATPGACKRHTPIYGCVLSYDIETSMKNVRPGAFGLVDSDILSIAASCSCGEEFYTDTTNSESCSSSMVSEFIMYVMDHRPMWTIGWNCYTFDNECMRYHAHERAKPLFTVSRIGGFGKATYGSLLNIPGTYNVDLLIYMSKSMYNLPSYKLGEVAKVLGVTKKLDMPDMREDVDKSILREYNMNDCVVVSEVWEKEKFGDLLPGLAICTASPIYDCARYVSGTLAAQAYSTFILNRRMRIVWSTYSNSGKYSGGYVMDPVRGVYNDIVVCDFSSMYPTIMFSCGINPHDFTELPREESVQPGTVAVDVNLTTVYLETKTVVFDNRRVSHMSELMRHLVEERTAVRKRYPIHGNVLKIAANSVYGSLGYANSSIYSPSCAAAITAVGRFCVKKSRDIFREHGLHVVYGDTDSCMVTCSGGGAEVKRKAQSALDDIHKFMRSCSLHRMTMALEEYYPKGIMLDKKRYCLLRENGTVKSTGISIARKDVSKVCQTAAEMTISAIFQGDRDDTVDSISSLVSSISCIGMAGKFKLKEVSRYVKKNERKGYEYPSRKEGLKFISEEDADVNSRVDCDVGRIMQNVSAEIERFTVPCGIGKVHDIVRRSRHIM